MTNTPITKPLFWGSALLACLLMLAVSFTDNVRGPLIPVLVNALQINFSEASLFLVIGQVFSTLSALFVFWSLRLFGMRRTTLGLCLFSTLSTIGAGWVTNYPTLMVLAAALGTAVGMGVAISNIIIIEHTPEERRGKFLAGLHAMYGLASIVSPWMVSTLLDRGFSWPSFFQVASPLFLLGLMAAALFAHDSPKPAERLAVATSGRWGTKVFVTTLFSFYVCGEALASGWMTSWLVSARGLTVAQAAPFLMGFFAVLATTRILCFLFLKEKFERAVLLAVLPAAVIFGWLGQTGNPAWLVMVGVLGPFYPVLLARLSRLFPDQWRGLTLVLLFVLPAVVGAFHWVMGKMADQWGMTMSYGIPMACQAVCLGLLVIFLVRERCWLHR